MISYEQKVEVFSNLMRIFEDQLEWILNRQYTSDPNYKNVLEIITSLHTKNQNDLINDIRELAVSFQELSVSIGERIKSLIDLSMEEVGHIKSKINDLEHQLQSCKDKVQTLDETRQVLSEKVAYWEKQYDILKVQAMEMQTKFEQQLRANKQQKKQLRRTFLQVQQQTEEDRKLLQNLQMEREEISEKVEQQKKQKETLLEEIEMLKRKVDSFEKNVKSTEGKVNYSQKKIAMLEEQIAEKNNIIKEYYESQRPAVRQFEQNSQIGTLINQKSLKRISQIQSKKLADEIALNSVEYQLEERKGKSLKNSFYSATSQQNNQQIIQYKDSILEEEEALEESRIEKRQVILPDIYFSHYLLTVQSVKLKIDRQEIFNIDMSKYYKRLVESTVPFHQWDNWIRDKLHEIYQKKK